MAIYGGTLTAPTVVGTHSGYVAQIKTGDFHTDALTGANKISNGGGNLQIYTDSSKTTRLPIDIVECVTGVSPSVLIYCRVPSMATATTLYAAADDVQTIQPAVGAAYGRNAVWSDYYGVFHCQDTSWTDSSGNGDLSPQGSNPPAVVSTPEGNAYRFDSADATFLTRAISITPLDRNLTLYSKSITKVFAGTPFYTLGVAGTLGGRDFSTGGINGTVTRRLQSVTPFSPVLATGALSGGSLTDQVVINITTWDSSDNFVIRGAYDGDLLNASGTTSAFSGDLIKMGLGGRVDASPEYFTFDLVGARFIESVLSTDYIDTQIDNEITPTWFTNDGWNLESGGSFTLDVDGGIYSTTGGALSLLHNRLLSTGGGVYSSTGSAVSLLHNRVLEIDGGTYSTTGANISLLHNRAINVDGGAYSHTGSAVDLVYTPIGGYTLDVDGGVFTSSGGDVDLLLNRAMQVDGGNYSTAGANAATLYNRAFSIDGGSFSYSGANINLLFNRALQTDGGVYSFTGGNVGLVYSGQITLLIDCYSVQFKQDEFTIDYQQDSVGIDYGCL